MAEQHIRSGTKSLIWRITGIIVLAIVTYAFTRNWIQTGLITVIHHLIFLFVFYLHERIWLRFPIKRYLVQSILKCFTYETLCGNIIHAIITYLVTGDIRQTTQITLVYVGIKHLMYVLNELGWKKIKWGISHAE